MINVRLVYNDNDSLTQSRDVKMPSVPRKGEYFYVSDDVGNRSVSTLIWRVSGQADIDQSDVKVLLT